LSVSTDEWQEDLRRLEEEIARSRQRRAELRHILDRLEQLNREAETLAATSPPPRPGGAGTRPLSADRGSAPPDAVPPPDGLPDAAPLREDGPPDAAPPRRDGPSGRTPLAPEAGAGEKARWKTRLRQAILERTPQAHLERTGALTAAVAGQLRVLEASLETAAQFCDNMGSRLRAGETDTPVPAHLVKEVVSSEHFRLLVARLLADFLRQPGVGPAHPTAAAILCSEPGQPQPTRKGKEVRTVKTQAPDPGLFWWIIIILLIFFLLLFFFPLGAGAGQ
jgi:hypothetical protein